MLGTLALASQAASAGVKRFIFISSAKVNGDATLIGNPFKPEDKSAPSCFYSISKSEAEEELWKLAQATKMEIVIVRPPMVYGPRVNGNFAKLVRLVKLRIPLPFGNVNNRRSIVGISNLVDFLCTCVWHPEAAGNTFLISDGEDISTPDLAKRIGKALGQEALMFPVHNSILSATISKVFYPSMAQGILGSLQVDISRTRELLDWTPVISLDEELRRTVVGIV